MTSGCKRQIINSRDREEGWQTSEVPVERSITAEDSEGLFSRQFLIDGPHQWDDFFIEAREAAAGLGRVPPHLLYLAERDVRSGRVTVQEILV